MENEKVDTVILEQIKEKERSASPTLRARDEIYVMSNLWKGIPSLPVTTKHGTQKNISEGLKSMIE